MSSTARNGPPEGAKALVVVCHPDPTSFNHGLAEAVRATWAELGYEVTFTDLHLQGFDPVLSLEEARGRPSGDPEVRRCIDELKAAELLAVVHPNCWGSPPAMMKGWIDRVFAPDAAYAFEKGGDDGDVPVGLLNTRAALVLNTGNTPPEREQETFGDPLARIWRDCLLNYCGVAVVERRLFGVVATSTAAQRSAWVAEAVELAAAMVSSGELQ